MLNDGRYAEATDVYLTIVRLNPDDPEAYHNLGLCYAHRAREGDGTAENLTTAALVALEKAVALSISVVRDVEPPLQPPFLTETYYLIGELRASQDDFGAAEKAYLSSGLPKAYHALAQLSARFASRRKESAKRGVTLETAQRYAKKAVHLDPNVASYYNTLALIEFRRGDYRQAEQAIRKALALEPENRNYQQGLKQISGKLAAD